VKFEINHGPSFASLFLTLDKSDSVRTEAGSMVAMSDGMEIKTKAYGGFFKALIRKLLGGESVFMNTYTPGGTEGELVLSPKIPGEVRHVDMSGDEFILQSSAYLASDPDIGLKTKYGGLKSMLSGEGLFLLAAKGKGNLWFNAYGNITEIEVDGKYTVDTGHIVGFEPGLKFKVKRVGGLKSTLFSGEGFVAEFSGKGKLYIQSRTLGSLVGWLTPMLPIR
jgi:uncharacterized protein (TIGR00266 family)